MRPRRSDLPFLRYGHCAAKSQIFIFVVIDLAIFQVEKTAWTPGKQKSLHCPLEGAGASCGKRDTKSLAIGPMV
jgi:hypothetical protein